MQDYQDRSYLSAIEASKFLNIPVKRLHELSKDGAINFEKAASGQMRYNILDLKRYLEGSKIEVKKAEPRPDRVTRVEINDTV